MSLDLINDLTDLINDDGNSGWYLNRSKILNLYEW